MKVNFKETLHLKTESELQNILKDTAFYSSEERLLALEELEKRGSMPRESAEIKEKLTGGTTNYQVLDTMPDRQIYKQGMMLVGSYIGGPLVAGYIIAENFKAFGETALARKTWMYAIIATIVIFTTLLAIPQEALDAIPNFLIPLSYTAAAYYYMQHFQDRNIGTHLASGGPVFSWWKVVGIGVVGLVVTMVAVMAAAILLLGDSAY